MSAPLGGDSARRAAARLLGPLVAILGIGLPAWAPTASAQSETNLWTEVGAILKPSRAWRLQGSLHTRFDRDISRLALLGPELRVGLRPARRLRIGGGYRFEWRRIGGELRAAHRFHLDLRWRPLRTERLRLDYRLRFQERLRDRPSGRSDVRGTLRNRLGLAWRATDALAPAISVETFTGVHGRNSGWLRKVRATLGVTLRVGSTDLETYYRAQVPIGRPDDPVEHILGLGARFRIELGGAEGPAS